MQNEELVVYAPNYRHRYGFFQTWKIMFGNIVRSRELIYQLFRRDFLNQYKKSFLGRGWLVVSPVIGVLSWVFLHQAGILNAGNVGIPFPAYVLLSSSIWGLFMSFYQSGVNTLTSGSGIIMQVKFPHEVLLMKEVAEQLANFTLGFTLNIVVLLIFGVVPAWQIVLFPLAILPMFFLGAGFGVVISMIGVVANDISKIATTLLGLVFYITPIIFNPAERSETVQRIVELNPLTYLVGGPRDLIIYGYIQHPERFLIATLASFIFFMLAWRLFFVSEDKLIEKLI